MNIQMETSCLVCISIFRFMRPLPRQSAIIKTNKHIGIVFQKSVLFVCGNYAVLGVQAIQPCYINHRRSLSNAMRLMLCRENW
jgi:hypothetical protein